jgi:hypothetical protein
MCPTWNDNGDVKSAPFATQFENLCNLAIHMLLKVDNDQTKPPAPNKHDKVPSIPADAVSEGGSVDEYATHVFPNSTKTAHIDPRDCIDSLPRAFNEALPPVIAYAPGLWTPRHDEINILLTEEKRISSRDEYRQLASYGVYSAAAATALEPTMATTRSPTTTAAERAHAWEVHDAAVRTYKLVTHFVAASVLLANCDTNRLCSSCCCCLCM